MKKQRYPLQPVVWDGKGVVRFQANPIVRYLLNWASERGMGLNELTINGSGLGWTKADWEHFAQLHGYSVSGWGGLSYVCDRTYVEAQEALDALLAKHPKDPGLRRRKKPVAQ